MHASIFSLTLGMPTCIFRDMDELRETRKTLGVTQVELADLLGLHQSTISRLESGALPLDGRTRLALEALTARQSRPASQRKAA